MSPLLCDIMDVDMEGEEGGEKKKMYSWEEDFRKTWITEGEDDASLRLLAQRMELEQKLNKRKEMQVEKERERGKRWKRWFVFLT